MTLDDQRSAALLILSRPRSCEELSLHWYARLRGLTDTEVRVLTALCHGLSPQAIAGRHGVALSTVRTQISNLRLKTGSRSIVDLVRHVMALPPLVNSLSHAVLRA